MQPAVPALLPQLLMVPLWSVFCIHSIAAAAAAAAAAASLQTSQLLQPTYFPRNVVL
jgi:hypothetical protein